MNEQKMVKTLLTGVVLLVLVLVAVSCGSQETATETAATPVPERDGATDTPAVDEGAGEEATSEPSLAGDPVRGGLMYDTWWVVIEADTPAGATERLGDERRDAPLAVGPADVD